MAKDYPTISPKAALAAAAAIGGAMPRGVSRTLDLTLEALREVTARRRDDVRLGAAEAGALLQYIARFNGAAPPAPPEVDPALRIELEALLRRGREIMKRLG